MTIWQSIQAAFTDRSGLRAVQTAYGRAANNRSAQARTVPGGKTDSPDTSEQAHAADAVIVNLEKLIRLRFRSSHIALTSQRKAFSSLSGNYNSTFKGRGLNFDEVRPYQPGDDIRNIDWNVTARTDRVHTKVFKEERERPVYLIVDLSSSMYFGTRHCLKSVTAAKAAALFAWAGADHANRIGGFIFNDWRHVELRPRGGHHGVLRFLKLLTDFHNRPQANHPPGNQAANVHTEPSGINRQHLFSRLRRVIHPGSIVLFVSDFNRVNKDDFRHLQYIARHNDLISVHVYDALEKNLPVSGQYGISDGESHLLLDTGNTSLRTAFEHHFVDKITAIEEFCLFNQVNLINLATDDNIENRFLTTLGKDTAIRRVARSRH